MFDSSERQIKRSGKPGDGNLCQYKDLSCVRCCLPHIGGDSCREYPAGESVPASPDKNPAGYLGPRGLRMKFKNFHSPKDPKFEASRYEDAFSDVGKEEMERRFSERRKLFLAIYDRTRPRESLLQYRNAAQRHEGYRYRPAASSGPVSLFLGGSVPAAPFQKGELPECHLLGFVDGRNKVGCLAHPLAESSQGFDGRDHAGFFQNTGCCENVGCEASHEFKFLSASALKFFDKAVDGMSWYQYSRHATSVLVHYLRSYDHLLQRLDEKALLDGWTLQRLVKFTNAFYDEWPLREPDRPALSVPDGDSKRMNSLKILSADIPPAERILYIALDAYFPQGPFAAPLQQARDFIERRLKALDNDERRPHIARQHEAGDEAMGLEK